MNVREVVCESEKREYPRGKRVAGGRNVQSTPEKEKSEREREVRLQRV